MRLEIADEERYRRRDVVSYDVWGDGQTLYNFLANEATMRRTPWSVEARTGWVWTSDGVDLASCETYELPCTVRGKVGKAWEIASVYTEGALRGRGHASAMLEALAERLGADPDAVAIVLFSDIGPALYERLGYVARPAWDRVFPAGKGKRPGRPTGPLRWPSSGDIRIDASPAQIEWHTLRRRVLGSPMSAFTGETRDGALAWIDPNDELLLLDVRFDRDPEALIASAAAAAALLGLTRVRAWETPEWPVTLGERIPREGALPMIKPLRPDVDPQGWTRIPRAVWV